jgi:hypothetical protein
VCVSPSLLASWQCTHIRMLVVRHASIVYSTVTFRTLLCCTVTYCVVLCCTAVLRHMSRIADFREACLSPELVTAYGAEDYITNIRYGPSYVTIRYATRCTLCMKCWCSQTNRVCVCVRTHRQSFTALKLVCWINTLEKRLFSAPYVTKV